MKLELYVSIDGLIYERLDLLKDESLLIKYIYKDTQELSKIYSPFSQSFSLSGSLNNQKALGFIGDTKIVKIKANDFDCKIYINGILAKKGILKINDVRYKDGGLSNYSANFTSNLLDLKTRMGDTLVSDLSDYNLDLRDPVIMSRLKTSLTEEIDGIKYTSFIPLVSNTRVLQHQPILTPNILNNINFNYTPNNNENYVLGSELTPALKFKTIIDLIKKKFELNIEMPLENELWYNDLYIFCNNKKKAFNNTVEYNPVSSAINRRYFISPNINEPNNLFNKYRLSVNTTTNVYTVTNNGTVPTYYQQDGKCYIDLYFNDVYNLIDDKETEINIILQTLNGLEFANQKIKIPNGGSGENGFFTIKDSHFINNTFNFKLKVSSSNPISYAFSDVQLHSFYKSPFLVNSTFQAIDTNKNTNQNSLTLINLFKALPDLKLIDFFTSFLKMFNISIFESEPESGKLFFLTPKDLKAENKIYSKKTVDYTDYVASRDFDKKIDRNFNFYEFKHKKNDYFNSTDFGNLQHPNVKPTKDLNEYKIETNFSILKSVNIAGLSTDYPTAYAFTNESPKISSNNNIIYKPNEKDFTIFFANNLVNLDFGYKYIYQNFTRKISRYRKIGSIHEATGFSLGFGLIEDATNESLYENFYKEQTERLLEPNTLKTTFKLKLPANEMFLNESNQKQGESNIPNGFRLQNDIIIQETKYSIIDATIDQTNGETTLNLLNYV